MTNRTLTGTEDTDLEVLYRLNGRDLLAACSVRPFQSLCNASFWRQKLITEGWLPPNGLLYYTPAVEIYRTMYRLTDDHDRAVWAVKRREADIVESLVARAKENDDDDLIDGVYNHVMATDDVRLYKRISVLDDPDVIFVNMKSSLENNSLEIFEMLVKASVGYDIDGHEIDSLLDVIFAAGNVEALKLLLIYRNADVVPHLPWHLNEWMRLEEQIPLRMIKMLVEYLAPRAAPYAVYRTLNLLPLAVSYDRQDVVDYCIDSMDWTDDELASALVTSVDGSSSSISNILIQAGADVHYNHDEALLKTAAKRSGRLTNLLLSNGADPSLLDKTAPGYNDAIDFIRKIEESKAKGPPKREKKKADTVTDYDD